MQHDRLSRLLVACGLVAAFVGALTVALTTTLFSTSVAGDATPELLHVDALRAPIEAELAADLFPILPPDAMSQETAAAVAARIVRDGAVVDDIGRAAQDAHGMWMSGQQPVLVLDPAVLTPAAIAAFRDIDLDLSRTAAEVGATLTPAPIAMPMTPAGADRVDAAKSLGWLLLIGGLVAFGVGAVLDERRDRSLRSLSTALVVLGLVLAVGTLLAPLPDLSGGGWVLPATLAMVGAARTPLVIAATASVLLGAFLRAVAGQIAPLVDARIEAKRRAAEGPVPVHTGSQRPRRRGRQVRQQAIDAFFAPASDDDGAEPDVAEVADASRAAYTLRDGDGFDRALDAVDAPPEPDEVAPEPEAERPVEDDPDAAAQAAEERQQALDRLDGRRAPLRTHLPR